MKVENVCVDDVLFQSLLRCLVSWALLEFWVLTYLGQVDA